jgi:hypothetical protein
MNLPEAAKENHKRLLGLSGSSQDCSWGAAWVKSEALPLRPALDYLEDLAVDGRIILM